MLMTSYQVAFKLARPLKLYTIAEELNKPCVLEMATTSRSKEGCLRSR